MGSHHVIMVCATNKAEDHDDQNHDRNESDHLTIPLRFISQRYQLG